MLAFLYNKKAQTRFNNLSSQKSAGKRVVLFFKFSYMYSLKPPN